VKQKGIEYFIEIARILIDAGVEGDFIIVGEGPLKPILEDCVKNRGIEDRVLFLGYQKEIIPIIKSFDILLFTSRYEPFGLVLTEAMAVGVPVVAMDQIGAVSEIIRDRIDGMLVKGADCESAAKCTLRLLEDEDLRRKLSNTAKERVSSMFSMKRNADLVRKEYGQLVKQHDLDS